MHLIIKLNKHKPINICLLYLYSHNRNFISIHLYRLILKNQNRCLLDMCQIQLSLYSRTVIVNQSQRINFIIWEGTVR